MVMSPELLRAADVLIRDYMAIRAGEVVVISADSQTDRAVVDAIFAGSNHVGASAVVVSMPQLPFQGALADPYIPKPLASAVAACDVWIDVTFPYLAGSHVHDEVMQAGATRYLLGGDMGEGQLRRLFGNVDLDQYYAVHQGFDALVTAAEGQPCRIANELGTDVTFTIAKPGFAKPRRADKPGMYLVPGSCTIFPELETVVGTVAVRAMFHEYFTEAPEPLRLDINGKVQTLQGGGAERRVMDRALRRAGGGDYGYVIHFTHGIHPGARQTGMSFIEDMRVTGNNAVGLGLPWWVPGGGENHPDAIAPMQSIWIDGQQIVSDGEIIHPPELAQLAAALQPRLA